VKRAFQIHPADNVATLLDDAGAEPVQIVGAPVPLEVPLVGPVALAHKIALRDIDAGEAILKYGVPIGIATEFIQRGEWVHLHNCRSALDERSSTLDVETGATTDMRYE
jgi:altronate dehydratase small subunit